MEIFPFILCIYRLFNIFFGRQIIRIRIKMILLHNIFDCAIETRYFFHIVR